MDWLVRLEASNNQEDNWADNHADNQADEWVWAKLHLFKITKKIMQMKKDENEKKVASFLKGCEKKEVN